MDISTKTITTKVHAATFSADDIKAVALSAVKGKVGVVDANLVSSQVDVSAGGSVTVEIVEAVPADVAQDGEKVDAPQNAAVDAPAQDPATATAPAAVPGFVPGFAKA